MTIAFGRAICCDLSAAERREWLVTNGLGGYASGTIAGTVTRRYHGLLVAAMEPPLDRRLFWTKLEEHASYRNAAYELFANRWRDDYVSPRGFECIESFEIEDGLPVWRYAFSDALLEKRVWMRRGANATYVRYRLLRAEDTVALTLRVFVNDRGFHQNTHGRSAGMDVSAEGNRLCVRSSAMPAGASLGFCSDRGLASAENVWYRDYVLSEESRRGLDDRDDNLSAGTFALSLLEGQSVTICGEMAAPSARFNAIEGGTGNEPGDHERQVLAAWDSTPHAPTAPAWLRQCVLAADQFVVARPSADDGDGLSLIAGYHWFGDWGRDTMIALPGLSLVTGRPEIARRVLLAFGSYVDGGMLPNVLPRDGETPSYNTVDAALWYVECVARYVEATADSVSLRRLWSSLKGIIESYRTGTRFGIHMDADGLIAAGEAGVALTWMDARVGDWVVTPRMGKPIEISALWYNALLRIASLARLLGESSDGYVAMARTTRVGFQRYVAPGVSGCFDVLDGPGGDDPTLRPNQIFAVSLIHSPLDDAARKAVVDRCSAHLLTSHGLRTLSSGDPRFAAGYGGEQRTRDAAYHQGTVWPWLLGHFALAHARVYGDPEKARSFLRPLADASSEHGLGTISEIADGAAPFAWRGAIAQAWSVAELIRAWCEISAMGKDQGEMPTADVSSRAAS